MSFLLKRKLQKINFKGINILEDVVEDVLFRLGNFVGTHEETYICPQRKIGIVDYTLRYTKKILRISFSVSKIDYDNLDFSTIKNIKLQLI